MGAAAVATGTDCGGASRRIWAGMRVVLPSAVKSRARGGCTIFGAIAGRVMLGSFVVGVVAVSFGFSWSVSLLVTKICSFLQPILNFKLLRMFSSGLGVGSSVIREAGVQEPSLLARIMTETVLAEGVGGGGGVGSGGGVLLKRRRANSLSCLMQTRFFHWYSTSSPSESEGWGVSKDGIGEARRLPKRVVVLEVSPSVICNKKKGMLDIPIFFWFNVEDLCEKPFVLIPF